MCRDWCPTNVDSVHLVTGCPDARAGVEIQWGRNPGTLEQPRATQILTPVTN